MARTPGTSVVTRSMVRVHAVSLHPSSRVLKHQERIQIVTMYAVPLVGLATVSVGLLGALGIIVSAVAPLMLIGAGVAILSGKPVATVIGKFFGENTVSGDEHEVGS